MQAPQLALHHTQCCCCFCLYFSILPVLSNLLEYTDLTVRLAVGRCVALLFELARDGPNECEELIDSEGSGLLYEAIQQLATESDRHTTRKDRNHTRSCFRDILLSLDVRPHPLSLYIYIYT